MIAVLVAIVLQQAAPNASAPGQVQWTTPVAPPVVAPVTPPPALPEAARADPYGYERAECSPYVRAASETLEACQFRIRTEMAAGLGQALPDGLKPSAEPERCRPDPQTGGFALDCNAARTVPVGPQLNDRRCETRPTASARGGVIYTETCTSGRPGEPERDSGLRFRLGGDD